jgi:epoxyqueuosine reductase
LVDLKAVIRELALEMGFDIVGVASADEFHDEEVAAVNRIRQGLMDGLPWFTEERVRRASNIHGLLPGAQSIISVGISYMVKDDDLEGPEGRPIGRIARYARGKDYHKFMKSRLQEMVLILSDRISRHVRGRIFVDDGPMLDRAAAVRGGLGWYGKNTNILSSSHGSWILLGEIITDLELEPDRRVLKSCGTCNICIEACPTQAIIAPYVLDNTRCISYLTIENRGVIPLEFRSHMSDWVFGCDICQEVCPVNLKASHSREVSFYGDNRSVAIVDLIELLGMTENDFHSRFAGTPVMRAKRVGMQRNACVALGNLGDVVAVPALIRILDKGDLMVRQHAAWALGAIGGSDAMAALRGAMLEQTVPEVLGEVSSAISING